MVQKEIPIMDLTYKVIKLRKIVEYLIRIKISNNNLG